MAQDSKPALQVIILGSGGGPVEHNTTAFLVRSTASGWKKGSMIAVDAGVHLGAIARILEATQPPGLGSEISLPHTLRSGPFAGLTVHSESAIANAAHVAHTLVDAYLITHPHLDHISGFVVNTAGLSGTRPKRLAGLPSTIEAFKTHIFNNVIWPNLSDENNGAGLVTYMRMVDGGSPAFGSGDNKGYTEVCDGLAAKMWSVSHGHCVERHSHRASTNSPACSHFGSFDSCASPRMSSLGPLSRRTSSIMMSMVPGGAGSAAAAAVASLAAERENICVYDSSAYFVRDTETGREVLIFGDVEPDSLSLSPRNRQVWSEAAPKIAAGRLAAILIECSYDNSQSDELLFGHLKPVFLMEELTALAAEVDAVRYAVPESRKRKRGSMTHEEAVATRRRVGQIAIPAPSWKPRDEPAAEEPISPTSQGPVGDAAAMERSIHSSDAVPAPITAAASTFAPESATSSASDSTSASIFTPASSSTFASTFASTFSPAFTPTFTPTHTSTATSTTTITATTTPREPLLTPQTDSSSSLAPSLDASHSPNSHRRPLCGLKVVLIHIKEKLNFSVDSQPPASETILREMRELEATAGLGCEFVVSHAGQSLYL